MGFSLGIFLTERALTRRYLVASCWKNTRSAGLEVLKGREMRVPDEARTYCRAKVRVRNWDVLQLDHRTPLEPSFRDEADDGGVRRGRELEFRSGYIASEKSAGCRRSVRYVA